MSEQVSDLNVDGSAGNVNPDPAPKNEVSYDTHRKLLGEKKTLQAAFVEAQKRLDDLEQAKLSSEGKKDELIQSLQKKVGESTEKLTKVVNAFQYRAVSNTFVEAAKAAGCIDPKKLQALADLSAVEVDIDNDFAVSEASVKSIIDNLKKEAPFFFNKGQVNIHDTTPNTKIQKEPTPAEKIKDLSRDDLMKLARSLDKR